MSILEHMEQLGNNRWRLTRYLTALCMDVRPGCRHYTLYSARKPGAILSVTVYDNVWNAGRQR